MVLDMSFLIILLFLGVKGDVNAISGNRTDGTDPADITNNDFCYKFIAFVVLLVTLMYAFIGCCRRMDCFSCRRTSPVNNSELAVLAVYSKSSSSSDRASASASDSDRPQ